MMMTPELNEQAARALLTGMDQHAADGLLLTLRSAASPRAAAIMRDSIERNYQSRPAQALPGTDITGRSALLIAICAGVMLNPMLLGHTALTGPDAERLIPLLYAALDAVAEAPDAAAEGAVAADLPG